MDEADLDRLRRTFTESRPVLVLGPGARRVGYDQDGAPGWADAWRRFAHLYLRLEEPDVGHETDSQQFLDQFWWARQSHETRNRQRFENRSLSRAPQTDTEGAQGETELAIEAAMWPLRLVVFGAFRTATVGLGATVAGGQRPVTSWASLHTEDGAHARRQRQAVRRAHLVVGAATRILKELEHHAQDWYPDSFYHDDEGDAVPGPLACSAHAMPAFQDFELAWREIRKKSFNRVRELLNLEAVEARLAELEGALTGKPGQSARTMSGATVEWLADLLWHVTTGDLAIPPSQADLAFYVNLHTGGNSTDHLTRARPGDHRLEPATLAAGHSAIERLVDRYDLPRGNTGTDEPASIRIRFARTMAATLALSGDKSSDRWRVAIVTDYDRALEQALTEVLPPQEGSFHVVLPVLLPNCDRPEWLFGTFDVGWTRSLGRFAEEVDWRWIDRAAGADLVKGPVVVRLSGSPTQRLAGQRLAGQTASKLGILRPHGYPRVDRDHLPIKAATLFSERDVLVALTSFLDLNLGDNSHDLGTQLVARARGVSWHQRRWCFLGSGFHDWLPRLHLFLSSRAAVQPSEEWSDDPSALNFGKLGGPSPALDQEPERTLFHHLAIDREFNWPERALLNATRVDTIDADLVEILDYVDPDATVGDGQPQVREYLQTILDATGHQS